MKGGAASEKLLFSLIWFDSCTLLLLLIHSSHYTAMIIEHPADSRQHRLGNCLWRNTLIHEEIIVTVDVE